MYIHHYQNYCRHHIARHCLPCYLHNNLSCKDLNIGHHLCCSHHHNTHHYSLLYLRRMQIYIGWNMCQSHSDCHHHTAHHCSQHCLHSNLLYMNWSMNHSYLHFHHHILLLHCCYQFHLHSIQLGIVMYIRLHLHCFHHHIVLHC